MSSRKTFVRHLQWGVYHPRNLKLAFLSGTGERSFRLRDLEEFFRFVTAWLREVVALEVGGRKVSVEKIEFHEKFGWVVQAGRRFAFLGKMDLTDRRLRITLGRNSYFSGPGLVAGGGILKIGSFCCIGENFFAMTGDDSHSFETLGFINFTRNQRLKYEGLLMRDETRLGPPSRIEIGHNVWVGRNVTVKAGVRIGNNSCLAEAALVRRHVPAYTVVGGIPGRVLRRLPRSGPRKKFEGWWDWSRQEILARQSLFVS